MKVSSRNLRAMALAIALTPDAVTACAPPPRREPPPQTCKPIRPRAEAWLRVLIQEGYLRPDGTTVPSVQPVPRAFEDEPVPPPPPPTRRPKDCRGCGRG